MTAMVIFVVRVTVVVVTVEQQPGARQVNQQPDRCQCDRLAEMDGDRRIKPRQRLVADRRRDQRQDHGAAERRQFAHLAGAEGEARVVRMAAREAVGERRDGERAGVRRHVPAVGHHRHRAEQGAADDLRHHHRRGKRDHEPGAPLVAVVLGPQENVAVLPGLDRMGVHRRLLRIALGNDINRARGGATFMTIITAP